jgi:hypothetical protein
MRLEGDGDLLIATYPSCNCILQRGAVRWLAAIEAVQRFDLFRL